MDSLDYFLRPADEDGQVVLLLRPECWDVCDWHERRVLGHFTYEDWFTSCVCTWAADVTRDRIFQSQKGFIRCHRLSDQQELWKLDIRGYEPSSLTLHPRTGDLLSNDAGVDLRSRNSGAKMKSWVPTETIEAFPHPSDTVTLLCRYVSVSKSGNQQSTEDRNVYDFYQEDSQQHVIAEVDWKDRPYRSFFHESYCCVEEIGGLIHCFDVHTGRRIWQLQVDEDHASITKGAFHEALGCWVFVTCGIPELWHVDATDGSILERRKLPKECGHIDDCFFFVDHGTKLLTIQGKLIDVATLEVIDEGIFARMGLEFETPLDEQVV